MQKEKSLDRSKFDMTAIDKEITATSKLCKSWKPQDEDDKKREELAVVCESMNKTLRSKIQILVDNIELVMKKNEELRQKELEKMGIGSLENNDPELKKKNQ